MMTRLIKNWYFISVFMAGLFALVLGIGSWNWSQKMILVNTIFIFLHFFEEFGFPGGFPPIAMKTELKLASDDPTEWPLNHVSAWFGNWWFALSVYLLALCLPEVKFLTLTVALFSFAELAMHTLYFSAGTQKSLQPWFNNGTYRSCSHVCRLFIGTMAEFYYLGLSACACLDVFPILDSFSLSYLSKIRKIFSGLWLF